MEKKKKISFNNYVFIWSIFLFVAIMSPGIVWYIYKILNLNFQINIDTILLYISSCFTFLGTMAVTLSSVYLTKKMNLENNLNNNKILLIEGKNKEIIFKADEDRVAFMFHTHINNSTIPDTINVRKLAIKNFESFYEKNNEKCIITDNTHKITSLIYPQADGELIISLYIDRNAPAELYKLVRNGKLSVEVSFDVIKFNVVTPVNYYADIIKKEQSGGMYTYRLMHPTLIVIDEPYFCK